MSNTKFVLQVVEIVFLFSSCATGYKVTGVERTRVLIDERYDTVEPDSFTLEFLKPYREVVDSVMSPIVGHLDRSLKSDRPESELSNLLADIMVWAGAKYGERPVLGLYNMGGIRASFPEGDITYGNVLDVAPFENKICFLTLTGEWMIELMRNIASVYGEGVSHGLEIVITKDGQLKGALLNGEEIDPQIEYRIATIDYLAEGNDRITAFQHKTKLFSPQEESNNTRYIICDYFREMARKGLSIDPRIEGRIRVEE